MTHTFIEWSDEQLEGYEVIVSNMVKKYDGIDDFMYDVWKRTLNEIWDEKKTRKENK